LLASNRTPPSDCSRPGSANIRPDLNVIGKTGVACSSGFVDGAMDIGTACFALIDRKDAGVTTAGPNFSTDDPEARPYCP
jgi:hypothetical protein